MLFTRRGKARRFRELAVPHLTFLYNVALKYTGSQFDAEDMVQETFCIALEKFDQLRDENKCKAWLFSILRSIYLRRLEKIGRNPILDPQDGVSYGDSLGQAATMIDPETALQQKLESWHVQKLLDRLPEKYKSPILLHYMEEMSYQEISDAMDLPIGTVMSRLARGREMLKTLLLRASLREASSQKVVDLNRTRERGFD
ncbi:MAG: sigma-70 family RNA polymerase sigma factor [Desulfomonile tiedjei]|uniref:Sigma-70 family RNA polymerase sigma factor n=1 Tax=Desulfomonile tiedjei TaxID=2358 RepID=A0A9D6UYJ0_9BACT|nr:sigma-70 family RNA polymerase sigma factor [Desulfomonile tiedjei]